MAHVVAIADDLDLDVAGPLDQRLDVDGGIAERGLGLAPTPLIGRAEVVAGSDLAHTTASSPGDGLDHDRSVFIMERFGLGKRCVAVRAVSQRHAEPFGQRAGLDLVPELP